MMLPLRGRAKMFDAAFPNRRPEVATGHRKPELLEFAFELLNRAPFPYLILSLNGAILNANNAAVELLGEEIVAVPRLPLIALLSTQDGQAFGQWLRCLRYERTSFLVTLRPRESAIEARLIPDLVRNNDEVLVLLAIEDLRELRNTEQRLSKLREQLELRVRERNRELAQTNDRLRSKIDECGVLELELRHRMRELDDADRAKDEFLALLAHELRNPLAPIRNALEVMRQDELQPATRIWAQSVIERQVEHLRRLVDDLLDLSRISRGKIVLQRRPVRLEEAVDRALEMSAPLIASRHHRVERRQWPEPLFVDADLERLAQAVANLLNNASKYMEPGGTIGIELERDGSDATLVVSDTGQGIDPELLPRVFDPFTQGDHSLHRTQGGLGIGLALVKRLIELHGGQVLARSSGPGLGSEFEMRLPCSSEHEPAAAPDRPRPEASPSRRVLIVEDNVDAAETLRMLLELHGHEAQVSYDAGSALTAAAQFHPDAMLLDIGLPDMSGRELVAILRSRPETSGALILAVSGYGSQADIDASRAAGFDQHLVKPVSPEALEAALAVRGATR